MCPLQFGMPKFRGRDCQDPHCAQGWEHLGADGQAVLRHAALGSGPVLSTVHSRTGAPVPTNPELPSVRTHDGREQKEAPRLQGAQAMASWLPGRACATTARWRRPIWNVLVAGLLHYFKRTLSQQLRTLPVGSESHAVVTTRGSKAVIYCFSSLFRWTGEEMR